MIPPVKRESEKIAEFYAACLEHDLDDEFNRAPGFMFYASDWLSSGTTALFDAEQRGWFIQLLARAWWNSRPQGTLPNGDEEVLKKWANYMEINGFSTKRQAAVIQAFGVTLDAYEAALDYPRRWSAVMAQFKPIPGAAALLHNPKMTRILMEAVENRRQKVRASHLGVEARREANVGNKGVSTKRRPHGSPPVVPTVDRTVDRGYDRTSTSSSSPSSTTRSVSQSPNLPSEVSMENLDLLGYALPSETTEEGGGKAGKERGTKFNPQKFLLTTTMVAWQQSKYPEFVDGDIAYLKEKFIAVFTGKIKQDWARTWYNFVNNEVVLHGYRPGDYDWRSKAGKPSKQESLNEQRIKQQQAIVAEEESRLRRGAGSSSGDGSENGSLFDESPSTLLPPNDPE